LGITLPAAAVAGFVIGHALDRRLHTGPILAMVMGFLGGGGGFIEILRILKKAEKDAGGNNSDTGTGAS
jgi:F0F1-type ATP synthase assembly protein I